VLWAAPGRFSFLFNQFRAILHAVTYTLRADFVPFIELDFAPLIELGAQHPLVISWMLFKWGGWVPVLFVLATGFRWIFILDRQIKFIGGVDPILLAIDVPKMTEQSPKAVENLFAHLQGTKSSLTWKERNIIGKIDPVFSFEIVSIDGYVQFLVRVWGRYRDVIEAVIYAQYPEAEIIEVEDYTKNVPQRWPNETHDLFGTEFILSKPTHYPIRTYPAFEHGLSAEFKDPMAGMLEALGRLQPGEQVWFQMAIQICEQDWKKAGEDLVKKLIGAKITPKATLADKLVSAPLSVIDELVKAVVESGGEPVKVKKDEPRSQMLFLSPGERTVVEQVGMKISKLGFKTKIRFIYIAPKGKLRTSTVIGFVRGAMSQFATLDMNKFGFGPGITTQRDYFWQMTSWSYYLSLTFFKSVNERMQNIFNGYKWRSTWVGRLPYYLNTEELATVWHFPVVTVKAPMVKKTESKRAEPPVGLPLERARPIRPAAQPPSAAPPGSPPPNLPTA